MRTQPIRWLITAVGAALLIASPVRATATERYALIVTGAPGGSQYAERYQKWRTAFVRTLRESFRYPDDHVVVLADEEGHGARRATGENVRSALADFAHRATKGDLVLVLLIGHGTGGDGDEAKFNLVGPDLSASEWADLVRAVPGRLVFVDTSSASFPFLQKLAARDRIVVTSTDSTAQQFETIFPEFFIKAFEGDEADLDKNGRVSIWEAFEFASRGARKWFEERSRLSTERPLLDDAGNGVGREAGTPGPDGSLARATYLQPEAAAMASSGDPEIDDLQRRRADLQSRIERLKAGKATAPQGNYEAELERLLLDLAQVERQIREKRTK
jgi:Caspase domain